MTRPVFLLSLPRAGSTLLQRLLLMSGKCATLGEPSLLLRFLGEDVAMTRRATYWESLVETATADMRKAWDGYDEAYRKGVRELMLGIYDGLAEGREWFLDKTPRYTLIGEEILATFPDAKFIVLWRHPLAVAASVSSTFRKSATTRSLRTAVMHGSASFRTGTGARGRENTFLESGRGG
ncbi:MAG: sulfotransferase [Verrucomicrobiaceae bacterium]|nr:MAG: sulfotransferase [Verrucomicrobiaceae bacterium]